MCVKGVCVVDVSAVVEHTVNESVQAPVLVQQSCVREVRFPLRLDSTSVAVIVSDTGAQAHV